LGKILERLAEVTRILERLTEEGEGGGRRECRTM
jgi:hypothetical protein